MRYRRAVLHGGTYFFTLVTSNRIKIFDAAENVQLLRDAFSEVRARHPFEIDAIVVLPDHLHCLWTLPKGDAAYSMRWRRIKTLISLRMSKGACEEVSESRIGKGERGLWQRRFWEHVIRDGEDFRKHVDYIHWNPVKHGLANAPVEWRWSSIHRYVARGILPPDWGGDIAPVEIEGGAGE